MTCRRTKGEILRLLIPLSAFISALFLNGSGLPSENKETFTLPPIIVSASRIPAAPNTTPAFSTIVTREQIENRQPFSVADLLHLVPGVHVEKPGGQGGIGSIYIRGADPNFSTIMINGIKLNDPTNSRGGSYDISTLDWTNVKRIEIIRGPLSAVYGSDAIGGVINIITRDEGDQTHNSVYGGGGLEGDYRIGLEGTGEFWILDYSFGASVNDHGKAIEGNHYTGRNFNLSSAVTISESTLFRLTTVFHENDRENFPDDSGGPTFAIIREKEDRKIREFAIGMVFEHRFSHNKKINIGANIYDRNERIQSPGVAPGVRDPFGIPNNSEDNDFYRFVLSTSSLYDVSDSLQLQVGADVQYENASGKSALNFPGMTIPNRFESSRTLYGFFTEIRFGIVDDLEIASAIRYDDSNEFDGKLNLRVGGVYRFNSDSTTIRGNWAQGYKVPSFFALENIIVGNPNLDPESSASWDFGIDHAFWEERIDFGIGLFYNELFDLIDFDEGPPPKLVNRSTVITQGIELSAKTDTTLPVSVFAQLTYTETDIKGIRDELRQRPEWRGGLGILWKPMESLKFNVDYAYIGRRSDSAIPTGDLTLDDYQLVSFNIIWTATPSIALSFFVDNLFDEEYEEAIGFPGPGIRYRLSSRIKF